MEIGLVLPHSCPAASPSFIRDFAQTAEGCGIARLWAVDHLVLPIHTDSLYPLGRRPTPVADGWLSDNLAPNFELVTTLSWVAGLTETIGIGSSIAVLPLRNPITNARQLASLDAYSGGRLVSGVGVGWLREEATAMGLPWDRRGARSEEHIAVLRRLWCADSSAVEFHGQFYDFAAMDPRPQPAQRPIPILIGGHSDMALERAVRIGDGWIAAPMHPGRLAERINTLERLADAHGRTSASLYKVASTTYSGPHILAETCDLSRQLGIDHLQVVFPGSEPGLVIKCLPEVAAEQSR